jgi:hypothetical protein
MVWTEEETRVVLGCSLELMYYELAGMFLNAGDAELGSLIVEHCLH